MCNSMVRISFSGDLTIQVRKRLGLKLLPTLTNSSTYEILPNPRWIAANYNMNCRTQNDLWTKREKIKQIFHTGQHWHLQHETYKCDFDIENWMQYNIWIMWIMRDEMKNEKQNFIAIWWWWLCVCVCLWRRGVLCVRLLWMINLFFCVNISRL